MQSLKENCNFSKSIFYPTRRSNLLEEFYIPALSNSYIYKRKAGYFTSSALSLASRGFSEFCKNKDAKMQLLIGAVIAENDIETLTESMITQNHKNIEDTITISLNKELDRTDIPDFEKDRLSGLAWMIENGILEIKIGLMLNNENYILTPDNALFHDKVGILEDKKGHKLSFIGSINETENGWKINGETFQVNYSWKEEDKVNETCRLFDEHWNTNGTSEKYLIHVTSFPEAVRKNWIKKYTPKAPSIMNEPIPTNNKWRHQKDALNWFLDPNGVNGIGILAMATGTGKTRTSIQIMDKLIQDKKIDHIIINTSDRLLKQWRREIVNHMNSKYLHEYWHNSKKREGFGFFDDQESQSILYTTYQLIRELNHFFEDSEYEIFRSRTLFVVDELHNIGSPENIKSFTKNIQIPTPKLIKGIDELDDHEQLNIENTQLHTNYKNFKYRLGLSATPFSEFNQHRNKFIISSFCAKKYEIKKDIDLIKDLTDKKLIYHFGLKDAINKNILTEFNYIPIEYEPTKSEKTETAELFSYWKQKADKGEASPEAPYIMSSLPYKRSVNKIKFFKKFIDENQYLLKNSVIFVLTKKYAREISKIVSEYTDNYREFVSGVNPEVLTEFSIGKFDLLITCDMISEGVDIQNIENIILFYSNLTKLGTIQRIGRALRLNPLKPTKISNVVDFIYERPEESLNEREDPDLLRKEWLSSIAFSTEYYPMEKS